MSKKIIEIVDIIDTSQVFTELSDAQSGGICVFVGTVREFTQGEEVETNTFNQEIRINNTNTDGKFDWSLGGFYQSVERDVYQNGTDGVDAEFGEAEYDVADYVNEINTIALFGFGDYKITDKFTASAGLDMILILLVKLMICL